MADFNDVATNENIQAIADAVRRLTGSEEPLTIPQIIATLQSISLQKVYVYVVVGTPGLQDHVQFVPERQPVLSYSNVAIYAFDVGEAYPTELLLDQYALDQGYTFNAVRLEPDWRDSESYVYVKNDSTVVIDGPYYGTEGIYNGFAIYLDIIPINN